MAEDDEDFTYVPPEGPVDSDDEKSEEIGDSIADVIASLAQEVHDAIREIKLSRNNLRDLNIPLTLGRVANAITILKGRHQDTSFLSKILDNMKKCQDDIDKLLENMLILEHFFIKWAKKVRTAEAYQAAKESWEEQATTSECKVCYIEKKLMKVCCGNMCYDCFVRHYIMSSAKRMKTTVLCPFCRKTIGRPAARLRLAADGEIS